jgi:hypothetical protein
VRTHAHTHALTLADTTAQTFARARLPGHSGPAPPSAAQPPPPARAGPSGSAGPSAGSVGEARGPACAAPGEPALSRSRRASLPELPGRPHSLCSPAPPQARAPPRPAAAKRLPAAPAPTPLKSERGLAAEPPSAMRGPLALHIHAARALARRNPSPVATAADLPGPAGLSDAGSQAAVGSGARISLALRRGSCPSLSVSSAESGDDLARALAGGHAHVRNSAAPATGLREFPAQNDPSIREPASAHRAQSTAAGVTPTHTSGVDPSEPPLPPRRALAFVVPAPRPQQTGDRSREPPAPLDPPRRLHSRALASEEAAAEAGARSFAPSARQPALASDRLGHALSGLPRSSDVTPSDDDSSDHELRADARPGKGEGEGEGEGEAEGEGEQGEGEEGEGEQGEGDVQLPDWPDEEPADDKQGADNVEADEPASADDECERGDPFARPPEADPDGAPAADDLAAWLGAEGADKTWVRPASAHSPRPPSSPRRAEGQAGAGSVLDELREVRAGRGGSGGSGGSGVIGLCRGRQRCGAALSSGAGSLAADARG